MQHIVSESDVDGSLHAWRYLIFKSVLLQLQTLR
jgi:hypothetical protein